MQVDAIPSGDLGHADAVAMSVDSGQISRGDEVSSKKRNPIRVVVPRLKCKGVDNPISHRRGVVANAIWYCSQ